MALPTIAINSTTGSDTTASGDGTAINVSGAAAATHSNTTINITDAVSLTGVPVDGSACLWVATSSGRRWSKITAISGSSGAWVVTVADAYGVTDAADAWAIGGKRATLNGSLQLGVDIRGGWTIDVQTNQTLTANWRIAPNAVGNFQTTFTSSAPTYDGAGRISGPVVNTSTNGIVALDNAGANHLLISHLVFRCSAATPGEGVRPVGFSNGGVTEMMLYDVLLDGWNNGIADTDTGNNVQVSGLALDRVEIKNCIRDGANIINKGAAFSDCYIHTNNTGGAGNAGLYSASGFLIASNCVFDGNKGCNVLCGSASSGNFVNSFINCVFSNAVSVASNGNGLSFGSNGGGSMVIKNCIMFGNVGWGVAGTSPLDVLVNLNNAYGGNGIGNRQTIPAGANDVTLTANPFASATDFALNSTAGGGAACKHAGAPQTLLSATATAPDVGAVQGGSGAAAGGGAPLSRVFTGM
jgi:hypothetical protein